MSAEPHAGQMKTKSSGRASAAHARAANPQRNSSRSREPRPRPSILRHDIEGEPQRIRADAGHLADPEMHDPHRAAPFAARRAVDYRQEVLHERRLMHLSSSSLREGSRPLCAARPAISPAISSAQRGPNDALRRSPCMILRALSCRPACTPNITTSSRHVELETAPSASAVTRSISWNDASRGVMRMSFGFILKTVPGSSPSSWIASTM